MNTFGYTILYVQDVEKTLTFYESAFGCTKKFTTPDLTYGELVTGSTTLSFASFTLAESNIKGGFQTVMQGDKPFGFEIGFVTEDVKKTLDSALAAGATIVSEPKTKPWGQVVAYVQDINGFLVEICTSVAVD